MTIRWFQGKSLKFKSDLGYTTILSITSDARIVQRRIDRWNAASADAETRFAMTVRDIISIKHHHGLITGRHRNVDSGRRPNKLNICYLPFLGQNLNSTTMDASTPHSTIWPVYTSSFTSSRRRVVSFECSGIPPWNKRNRRETPTAAAVAQQP